MVRGRGRKDSEGKRGGGGDCEGRRNGEGISSFNKHLCDNSGRTLQVWVVPVPATSSSPLFLLRSPENTNSHC